MALGAPDDPGGEGRDPTKAQQHMIEEFVRRSGDHGSSAQRRTAAPRWCGWNTRWAGGTSGPALPIGLLARRTVGAAAYLMWDSRSTSAADPSTPEVAWDGNHSARRLVLSNELKRMRIESGMTPVQAATHLGCRVSKISRIELAQSDIAAGDAKMLAEFYGDTI
ncbi:MAG: helix-turn-helix domain-containing protein, partial [Pseudonocardiaceae bacterium]